MVVWVDAVGGNSEDRRNGRRCRSLEGSRTGAAHLLLARCPALRSAGCPRRRGSTGAEPGHIRRRGSSTQSLVDAQHAGAHTGWTGQTTAPGYGSWPSAVNPATSARRLGATAYAGTETRVFPAPSA